MALTIADYTILFLMNLIVSGIVTYYINYAKRKGELVAEEEFNNNEYLKNTVRTSISEIRGILAELSINDFHIQSENWDLTRMNILVQRISLVDTELGKKLWKLVNAQVLLDLTDELARHSKHDEKLRSKIEKIRDGYEEDLKWALLRSAEIEKTPIQGNKS